MIDIEATNLTIVQAPPTPKAGAPRARPVAALMAIGIIVMGIALRLWLPVGFHGMGFDEALYRAYVIALDERGIAEYDTITQSYLVDQRRSDAVCKLPPTRFLYVYSAWLLKRTTFGEAPPLDLKQPGTVANDPALVSLHRVSRFFSVLLLILSGVVSWRVFGKTPALVVLALMAAAPLQLHMAGHALIDGFFAFWATLVLWSLWENLQQPRRLGWLAVYGGAVVMMILTKENAFFVVVAAVALLVANRWAKFGKTTRPLWYVTFVAPAVGAAMLVKLAGSLPSLLEVYRLLVAKAEHLDYAILTGDGPWHRYLIDEMVLNPVVLCLAIGGVFGVARKERPYLYLAGFIFFSYAVMCQVRHGMNLRYATIWDFPLCALAAGQLLDLSKSLKRWPQLTLGTAVALICGYDLWQYWTFFVKDRLYEIPTESLLQAVDILKS